MGKEPDNVHEETRPNADKARMEAVFRAILLTLAASFIYAMNAGIRNNYGIMLNSIVASSGISFASVSFILAVGQLIFGLVQPGFGIMAAKKGNAHVLVSGLVLTLTGMLLTPFCRSLLTLMICLGFILPAGSGAISYGVLMGTISPKVSPRYLANISGLVNASSGIGNTVMSPVINALIRAGGFLNGMLVLSVPMLLTLPLSLFLSRKEKKPASSIVHAEMPKPAEPMKLDMGAMFQEAMKSRTYIFLMIGFFTCGFHMALIMNHLPTQIQTYGFSSQVAANAFSIYGVTTILGSVLSGSLCGKFKMKNILAFYYGLRPVTILAFLLMPKTVLSIFVFTALFGFSGAATVPPVAGIINRKFGAGSIATLYGLVFVIHQIGGFFGVWLGGISFSATNSYALIWGVSAVLGALASLVSLAIIDGKTDGSVKSLPGAAKAYSSEC